jgi:hypothetical protein
VRCHAELIVVEIRLLWRIEDESSTRDRPIELSGEVIQVEAQARGECTEQDFVRIDWRRGRTRSAWGASRQGIRATDWVRGGCLSARIGDVATSSIPQMKLSFRSGFAPDTSWLRPS